MRAINVRQFGPPEVKKIDEVADPRADKGEVIVRLSAAEVTPVNTYIRAGLYARNSVLPYTPGMDGVGVIESVGEGITGMTVDPRDRMGRNGTILGMVILKAPEQERKAICAALAAGLETGILDPVVGKNVPLSDAFQAITR